jgi:putative transposase
MADVGEARDPAGRTGEGEPHSRALRLWRQDLPSHTYFVRWCTHHREPLLGGGDAAAQVVEALRYAESSGWALVFGYVAMPDHVHVLVKLGQGKPLSGLMMSVKSYTARRINQLLRRSGPVWQTQYREPLIVDWQDAEGCLNYMAMNPVKAGLARRPGEYPWCSVAGLAGEGRERQ